MKVQQNKNSTPSFGINIIKTKRFSDYAKKQGWDDELKDIFQKIEAKFPQDKRTFEVAPNHILAEEKGDKLGMTYEFAEKNTNFKTPEEIKRAIIKTVAGRKAMETIPKYVEKLNKKFGLAIDFNPRNISSAAGNNARSIAQALHSAAKTLASIPNQKKYSVRIYNDGSSSTLTLKIGRKQKQIADFLFFMQNSKNPEKIAQKSLLETIKHLNAKSIQELKRNRKKDNKAKRNGF